QWSELLIYVPAPCAPTSRGPRQAALSTLQIDRRTLHFGLRILRLDRDRLRVATRHQVQLGGKCRSLGHDLKPRAVDLAGHGAGGIAGGFAPAACDRVPGIGRAAAKIEIIAGACTVDIELKLVLLV